MRIELPIIVRSGVESQGSERLYVVQPLFFDDIVERDKSLSRATNRLVSRLQRLLSTLAREGNHREIAEYAYCPDVALHRLKLRIEMRSRTLDAVFPVATFWHLSRRIAVSPFLLEVWFEVQRNLSLERRAEEVYTAYFRDIEKQDNGESLEEAMGRIQASGKHWLDHLEFTINTTQRVETSRDTPFAILGLSGPMDGARELESVGRCLDRLFPDDLQRYRDSSVVDELMRAFTPGNSQPVLIVGPPLVGKTALVHALVHRRVAGRKGSVYAQKKNTWLLSPQRLISGMSYVGQWEDRLLAILKTARKQNHLLYFDDMLGLYHAGISRQSSLSVADVLKPYVQRGEVNLLAEMTPESLRVFRERDRGFADLFHLVHVDEPPPSDLFAILLETLRDLEQQHGCIFNIDVLPTVLQLTRRYQNELAYPGKAVRLIKRLAVSHSGQSIDRTMLLDQFHTLSGMDLRLLDTRVKLDREEVASDLRTRVLGQPEVIDAMADVVIVAKAGLNDPHQPLASLLFTGPTGVGKTESGKTLAEYLFHDEERLLRFDMNEFVSPLSAARLMGTFDQPEGLLTRAVRERPFAVVLFDEIEKAHPNVFDLLLQVLGEARLTDALGRTVDFSNIVVIMTSNLGTREAGRELGFSESERSQGNVYLKAVREFFRPEFFNRIDRIVPFQRLGHEELEKLAQRVVRDVLARDGFSRRHCALDLGGDAIEWVTDQGYNAMLGARAMKRAVEHHVVQPAARQLAGIPKSLPTVVSLHRHGGKLCVGTTALHEAEPFANSKRPRESLRPGRALSRIRTALDRIRNECEQHRPQGALTADGLNANVVWYLGVTELLHVVRERTSDVLNRVGAVRSATMLPRIAPKAAKERIQFLRNDFNAKSMRNHLKEMVAAQDIHDYLLDLCEDVATACATDVLAQQVLDLLDWLALLDSLCPSVEGWPQQQALILVRGLADSHRERNSLIPDLQSSYRFTPSWDLAHNQDLFPDVGLDASRWPGGTATSQTHHQAVKDPASSTFWWETYPDERIRRHSRECLNMDVLAVEGYRACELAALDEGTYLFHDDGGRFKPLQVVVLPVDDGRCQEDVMADCLQKAEDDSGPFSWRQVVAIYASNWGKSARAYRRIVDFRAGLTSAVGDRIPAPQAFRATLPLPPELKEL